MLTTTHKAFFGFPMIGLHASSYTVDGMIEGENSGGTTVNYLPDALGSVIGASAGATILSRTVTPYGIETQMSLVAFGWAGAHGYRQVQLASVSHYVRARHYS